MRIISLGGFIDYQIQLANALSRKNTVMLVIFANTLPDENIETIEKKVDFHLLGRGRPSYHPTSLLILKDFIKKMNEFKPDVIHLQLGGGIIDLALLPFFKKYPVVSTFHDIKLHAGENNWWQNFIRYWIRKYSNQIIVHGEKLKEQMIEEYNIPEEKVHAIPIGEHEVAPFKKYEREDIKEDGNLILFFGRIWKYKGLEYLIKAEPLITKEVPDAKIIVAGTGENFKNYEKMMVNRDNFIVHNRYIPYKEGAELFQRCSLVALPYIDASQSGVIPTAYGFKRPVVVTNVGSIPEIVDNGITGFIVPPKNPEALAEAIVKLLKDEKLRKQMGENAYKKLKTDLSWDNIAEKTIEVYEKAIEDRSRNTEHLNIYRN
jgi:glycosyltransferase involved in cell wall biosynthesis